MSTTTDFLSRCYLLDPSTDKDVWDKAWEGMAADGINDGQADRFSAECPLSGEGWQYMGSYHKPAGTVHEFRHRHHPAVNRRVLKRVFIRAA